MSTTKMKALTLHRPWAEWVILGWKTIETRTHTRFRGLADSLEPTPLAIHAGMKWDDNAIEAARDFLTPEQIRTTETIIKQESKPGHVIGTVLVSQFFGPLSRVYEKQALIECRSVTRYGLWLSDAKPLRPPLKVKGQQGLFTVEIPTSNETPA